MHREKHARAFLDVKLGNEPLVAGDARQAAPRDVIGAALQRLAELRRQRQREARDLSEDGR